MWCGITEFNLKTKKMVIHIIHTDYTSVMQLTCHFLCPPSGVNAIFLWISCRSPYDAFSDCWKVAEVLLHISLT